MKIDVSAIGGSRPALGFRVRVAMLVCFFCLSAVADTGVYDFRSKPTDGDSTVFYDVDMEGRLLRIDYQGHKARVLARLPDDIVTPEFDGWFVPDASAVYFYVLETPRQQPVLQRFDLGSGQISATTVTLNPLVGTTGIAGTAQSFWLDPGTEVPIVLHTETGEVLRPDLPFPPEDYSLSDDGKLMYIGFGLAFTALDTRTGQIESKGGLEALLPHVTDGMYAYVWGIRQNVAVIASGKRGEAWRQYAVIDLCAQQCLATSPRMKSYNDLNLVVPGHGNRLLLACIDRTYHSTGHREFTGTVERLAVDLDTGDFTQMEPLRCDPEHEMVLTDPDNKLVICPRVQFDYVSRAMACEKGDVRLRAPETDTEKAERIAGLDAGLKANVGKMFPDHELFLEPMSRELKVAHLEIEDSQSNATEGAGSEGLSLSAP